MGHEINGDDGIPTQVQVNASWARPQNRERESESELDEEIDLATAGNSVVGKSKVDEEGKILLCATTDFAT